MRGFMKYAVVMGGVAVAAASHAVTFATYAYDSPAYTLLAVGPPTLIDGDATVYAQVGGLNFVTDEISLSVAALAGTSFPATGDVTLTSVNGSKLFGDFDGQAYNGLFSPFISFAGNVVFTGGTGDFSGWTGVGTASGSFLVTGAVLPGDTYDGSLNIGGTAVPEPASFAVVGIGLATLLRRRRKA